MNELIRVVKKENGEQVVSARELHDFLGAGSNVNTWFKNQAERAMLENGLDFIQIFEESTGGRKAVDYAINISAAKEIAMLNGGEKGKQARKYFIECEKIALNQKPKQLSRLEILELALESEKKVLQLEAKIEQDKEKVHFFDTVTGSEDCIDMGQVAKVCNLGIGRNRLFEFLRENKILDGKNSPYQTYIDRGYFRTIESSYTKPDGSTHISIKTVVFQKGVDFIIKKYNNR